MSRNPAVWQLRKNKTDGPNGRRPEPKVRSKLSLRILRKVTTFATKRSFFGPAGREPRALV